MFPASIFLLGLAISTLSAITDSHADPRSVAADDWTLVFEDEFTDQNDSLADWSRFGGTSSRTTGRKGRGLLIETEGGLAEPAYAGAVNRLGGGIKPNEIVTAETVWRAIGDQPSDAVLSVKLEFKDLNGGTIGSEETLVALGEAADGKWETTTIAARVPASASSTDLVLVLVPGQQKGTLRVLFDEVSATRAAPPLDLLAGAGGFESSDGGAADWTVHNNALTVDIGEGERAFKSWGPFGEPYSGSIMEQTVPLEKIRAGTKVHIKVDALTPGDDSIAGTGNFPIMKVECLAADGRPLAHIEARPFDPTNGEVPINKWTSASVEVPAPEGTVAARFILGFIQPTTESGAIFFKKPRLSVGSSSKNLLMNPDLKSSDTALPGWTVEGALETGDRYHRGGATALKFGPQGPSSATRSVNNWKVGQTLNFEAWSKIPTGSRGSGDSFSMEVVQIDRRDRAIDTQKRTAGWSDAEKWRTTGNGPLVLQIEVLRNTKKIQLVLRGPVGGGEVWVDDVVVNRADSTEGLATAIPIRNPGFEGFRPDEGRWAVSDGAWSHNGELQYYAPDSIVVNRKRMNITADRRRIGDREYSSGHVSTEGKHEQKYGKWEIRAKLPNSQGMWPAIWLLPVDGSWPPEIDIIELVGKEPNKVHHSFHWGPLRDGLLPWDLGQTSTDDHVGKNYDTVFHDFGLEWTPDGIVWTIDGKETHRFGTTDAERKNLPQGPMYLIMNLALGGFWPGPPGEDTTFPSTMEIDHVKIWKWNAPDG
ncbi:MAG: glycoside hydrolase family 16 protein [Phycisphaerales bacterium]|nr:glycoside hydrolase family 16 protein [Phycisphaerales bacterium]